ncbi:LysR family transcriptional regulator [Bifidobacterium miconisargentati]|uniref:LysR family transcriptional regulator n=1 Tax=Bifidobacterium miconisargentati TaxID=2834437 RepID=UPI001BDBB8B8|nr:LysR family transcriptional regulator [Bifidobacterium miconisargentati]MBW3090096.1 LysR family transcriptional regulator [Bifidobacterium miconisargentati]
MLDPAIDVFIQVTQSGSFTKASEKLYISPTAVMNQINRLEAYVGVRLLERGSTGIRLTDAGKVFHHDALRLVSMSEKAREHARQADASHVEEIRIGTSVLYPCKPLLDRWNRITNQSETKHKAERYRLSIISFDDNERTISRTFANIGRDFDVMIGPYGNAVHPYETLTLEQDRMCIAVPEGHRLAGTEHVGVDDLKGEQLLLPAPGNHSGPDALRRWLTENHPEIEVVSTSAYYGISVFNRCIQDNMVLVTLNHWRDVHPMLHTISVDWEFSVSYGLIYPKNASSAIRNFVSLIEKEDGTSPQAHSPSLPEHRLGRGGGDHDQTAEHDGAQHQRAEVRDHVLP